MGLADISDDEVVAEIQRRLDKGTVGYAGLFSNNQINYRDNWHDIGRVIAEASLQAFDHPQVAAIRQRYHQLAGTSTPLPFKVFGLNTTLHGQDRPEDHQAEWHKIAAE